MMDPRMMVAPMPPSGGAGEPMGAPAAASMSPVEAVVMALKGMQVQRKGENDALMMAVLQATGAMPNGLAGVAEGAPIAVPAGMKKQGECESCDGSDPGCPECGGMGS